MKSAEASRIRLWLPYLLIIAATALAHLWCLGSQFYMDDMNQIRDSEVVLNGNLLPLNQNSWTQLFYVLQYRLFGMTPVAFHAVNWLLHTAVACTLFGFGRDFLRGKWPEGVALFGALLFAVHPLASEIPNYARTQDLAWVTLFSLLAAWAMLLYLREGGWELVPGTDGQIPVLQRTNRWWKLLFCGLAVMGATFSKGPGLFHAAMAVAVVTLATVAQGNTSGLRMMGKRPLGALFGIFAAVIGVLWATGLLHGLLALTAMWKEPRFIGNAYTLSRVFWEFAWRSVIPVALSSDHLIAETLIPPGAPFWNIPDKGAMFAAACFIILTAFSVFLFSRKSTQLFGACLFLFAANILFRVLFPMPEFMPEYRIYPGLPWFCLGAAMLLAASWKTLFETVSPRVPAAVLLAVFAFLSAKRSFQWHDLDRLMANVLEQYPAQARAIWVINSRDLSIGDWQAVIDRHERDWPEVRRKFINSLSSRPAREIPTGHFSMAEVACTGGYARAVAHQRSPVEGIRIINQLEAYMQAMKIDPHTNPVHWDIFHLDKALVLEIAGSYQAALDSLSRKDLPPLSPRDYQRIERKLAIPQGTIKPGS